MTARAMTMMRRLGDVAPSSAAANPQGDSVWMLNLDQVEAQTGRVLSHLKVSRQSVGQSTNAFDEENVLYCKLRPYLNKVVLPNGGGFATSELVPLRPDPKALDRRYLTHFLRSSKFVAWASKKTAGAKMPRLSMDQFWDYQIPILGLPEQRRIADILDQADALRRKQQKADLLADDLIHALFLDIFGNPVQNPKGWNTGTLRDLIEDIEAGWSAKGEDRPLEPKEMGVLRVSAVTSGVYKPEEAKAVSDLQGRSVIVPKKGDLLFSRANTKELVAATCLIHEEDLHVFLPDKLWRLIPRKGRATTAFLKYLISFPRFRWTIASKATGTSGSMLNISQDKVLETPCIIPPHDLMQRFHRAVFEIAEVRIQQHKAIECGHGAFDSLSQQFFG